MEQLREPCIPFAEPLFRYRFTAFLLLFSASCEEQQAGPEAYTE